jgi:hypothetical protein
MPTACTVVRLDPALIDSARAELKLPAETPVARVLRAALERLTGYPDSAGVAADRGGRPRKNPNPGK